MNKPVVSVIIPTHNRAALLREALDSVRAQTFRDFELIVIDDESTEDIEAAVAGHAARPRVVRQAHLGPAAARNRGIQEAAADFVAFLDSDDLWHPTKLEVFLRAADQNPDCSIFYGPMSPIDLQGNPVPGRTKRCYDGWITQKLFCSSFVHVPTILCRKDALLAVGGFDAALPVCEDYDLWLRLSVRERFGLIKEPLAKRRLHGDRLSKALMGRNLAVKAEVLQRFFDSGVANGQLDNGVARARLARVLFVAGRAAFKDRRYQQAIELCRKSRSCGGSALRTVPLMAGAGMLGLLGHDSPELQSIR